MLFISYSNIFDSDLKEFFKDTAFEEEKNIDYQLLSKQILISSKNMFSFLDKYGDLYTFCINLFYNKINLDDFKLQQVEFLKNLMNGFEVYKKNQETK